MVTNKEESRTIRISQEVYDYLDTRALRGTETFDQIIRRLLKIKAKGDKNGG